MAGRKCGRLIVMELAGYNAQGQAMWLCACECGAFTVQRGYALRSGRIVSCGCARRDLTIKRAIRLQLPAQKRRAIAKQGAAAAAAWRAQLPPR